MTGLGGAGAMLGPGKLSENLEVLLGGVCGGPGVDCDSGLSPDCGLDNDLGLSSDCGVDTDPGLSSDCDVDIEPGLSIDCDILGLCTDRGIDLNSDS